MSKANKVIEDEDEKFINEPLIRDPQFYLGNPRLKKVGVTMEWTPENIREYDKCSKDILYFVEKYIKIVNVDDGLVPFKMYRYQKKMLRSMAIKRRTIITTARQVGKSTVASAFIVWYILFNKDKTVAMLANKGDTAREILGRVQLAYEHLPLWLQQGVKEWNKGSLLLENNSRVLAGSTSSSAIRGFSINCVGAKTQVTVRNKHTGTISRINIDELAHTLMETETHAEQNEEENCRICLSDDE